MEVPPSDGAPINRATVAGGQGSEVRQTIQLELVLEGSLSMVL